jgi:hypothetical protein
MAVQRPGGVGPSSTTLSEEREILTVCRKSVGIPF